MVANHLLRSHDCETRQIGSHKKVVLSKEGEQNGVVSCRGRQKFIGSADHIDHIANGEVTVGRIDHAAPERSGRSRDSSEVAPPAIPAYLLRAGASGKRNKDHTYART